MLAGPVRDLLPDPGRSINSIASDDSIPASRRTSQTVEAATFTPRTSSSPWRRR
ncbi:hypothetical protein ABZT51_49420 [Streptomyces sp. NPDC005373]|uniref:hypothetical protein n=1 Tax=Streptomyces sp. NPDC005373 TaxID=3156879 RepID=UPI0033B8C680